MKDLHRELLLDRTVTQLGTQHGLLSRGFRLAYRAFHLQRATGCSKHRHGTGRQLCLAHWIPELNVLTCFAGWPDVRSQFQYQIGRLACSVYSTCLLVWPAGTPAGTPAGSNC